MWNPSVGNGSVNELQNFQKIRQDLLNIERQSNMWISLQLILHLWYCSFVLLSLCQAQVTHWSDFETSLARGRSFNGTRWAGFDVQLQEILTGGNRLHKAELIRFFLYPDPSDIFYYEELFFHDFTSITTSSFDMNLPTKFLIHGFGHGHNCSFPQEVKDVYLLYQLPFNVIVVDWGPLAMDTQGPNAIAKIKNYVIASENIPIVGNRIGDFITYLWHLSNYDTGLVHIVGFSLGAHAAGCAGKRVYDGTQRKIGRITGLDPAGPLYHTGMVGRHLKDSDASYVDFVHTDMGQSGTTYSLGHSNFFVNGGKPKQPGCVSSLFGFDSLVDKVPHAVFGSCSHSTAPLYFSQSVARTEDFILAKRCSSWFAYKSGLCSYNEVTIFGEFSLSRARGNYFLELKPQQRSGLYTC